MKENEYQCAICGGIFEKGWSDEEAEKEVKDLWGDIPAGERVIMCDDCFSRRTAKELNQMGEEYKNEKGWQN